MYRNLEFVINIFALVTVPFLHGTQNVRQTAFLHRRHLRLFLDLGNFTGARFHDALLCPHGSPASRALSSIHALCLPKHDPICGRESHCLFVLEVYTRPVTLLGTDAADPGAARPVPESGDSVDAGLALWLRFPETRRLPDHDFGQVVQIVACDAHEFSDASSHV